MSPGTRPPNILPPPPGGQGDSVIDPASDRTSDADRPCALGPGRGHSEG
jgi:hypothetical protein